MTTEFSIPSRNDIEKSMTLFGPLRNRQTLVVCILTNSQPGLPLYDTSSLEAFRDKYWSSATVLSDPDLATDFEKAKRYNQSAFGISDAADRQTLWDKVIKPWADLLNISITRTENPALANVRLGIGPDENVNYTPGPKVNARFGESPVSDVFLDKFNLGIGVTNARNIDDWLHEFGHALGLSHPARDAGNLPFSEYDKNRWTAMGYDNAGVVPVMPMLFDALGLNILGLLKAQINSGDGDVYTIDATP